MDVSIIILNYKSKGLVRQQLKHFFLQKIRCSIEMIVVDNNSGDDIDQMMKENFPQAVFVQSPDNRGYAAGNNIGIKKSTGDYILIANPDIVLSAEAIDGLHAFMESHPKVGIAGPKLINADGSLHYSCLRFPDFRLPLFRRTAFAQTAGGKKWLSHYFMEEWDHADARDVDWLFGACLIVRREALEAVGLLDERFFLYLEDTDWCRRFWERQWQVFYVPTVSMIHLLRRSSEGSLISIVFNKTARVHLQSFIKYLVKYRGKKNPHRAAL